MYSCDSSRKKTIQSIRRSPGRAGVEPEEVRPCYRYPRTAITLRRGWVSAQGGNLTITRYTRVVTVTCLRWQNPRSRAVSPLREW